MKKLVFTALAVVAFSGAGMAKTNSLNITKKNQNIKTTIVKKTCKEIAIEFYEIIVGDGSDDIKLLNRLLSYCS
ncbi:hypothetical protein [Flavobacterium sp.]|uniref:hypothetical protein n=1 Tax=Flavobacterium sp. TaxID=239 RepID=UPI003D0C2EC1